MVARIEHLVALPDEIGFAEAAPLLCAGLTTYTGFRKAALAPGQRTVVIGGGWPWPPGDLDRGRSRRPCLRGDRQSHQGPRRTRTPEPYSPAVQKTSLAAAANVPLPIDALQFLTHQLQVFGTFFGSSSDLEELLALAITHGIRPQIERYRIEDVNQAQDNLRNNKVRYRAVVEF
ncbi:hypothetical protein [Mycobacteroides abscessus]|uniref:hypothetical protein n=1 Tax=Mycobacteroides abscessus TaxID=36809 RepID=UPI00092846F8|nr:hypothetical protein [Mycobacteroides abscessus]SHW89480.1 Zn-dependent alcohol dehydrogenase [Mycobacteroides abscessus subsp. abscessus]